MITLRPVVARQAGSAGVVGNKVYAGAVRAAPPRAQFYGHNPNLKLPPDLFLLGCVFHIVSILGKVFIFCIQILNVFVVLYFFNKIFYECRRGAGALACDCGFDSYSGK